MNEEHREQYLMHYGVLGMKWGIRRRRTGSGVSRSSGKKVKETNVVKKNQNGKKTKRRMSNAELMARVKDLRKEATKRRMSNAELTARVKRLRLEAEYSRLVKETTPVTVSKIDKAINAANTISKMSKSAVDLYNNLNAAYEVASKAGLVKKKKK